MTTLRDICQKRLRAQRDEDMAQDAERAALQARLGAEGQEVIRLVKRDVLLDAKLPADSTIGLSNSTIYGHHVVVRLPGRKSITAKDLYIADDDRLLIPGCTVLSQRWEAVNFETNKKKTFDNFFDAAIWLLGIELDDAPDSQFGVWQFERMPPELDDEGDNA